MVINNEQRMLGCFYLVLLMITSSPYAASQSILHGLYAGIIGGYGSTTWDGLVPSARNQRLALNLSTPVEVDEGGGVVGGLVGLQLGSCFAIEANYIKYPDARIVFDEFSLFSLDHNNQTEFVSSTESYNVIGKVMLVIPKTKFKVFSGAGIASLHREDLVLDDWRSSPTFSVGLIYPLTDHFMTELSGNYTAGFGESQLNPAESYYPFLYSATVRLAYVF